MSGWIHNGLQILKDYFGAEDDEEEKAVVAAVQEAAVTELRTRCTSNNDIVTTTEGSEQQQWQGTNKRKAVGNDDADVDPGQSNNEPHENSPKRSHHRKKRVRQNKSKSQEKYDNETDDDDIGTGDVVELYVTCLSLLVCFCRVDTYKVFCVQSHPLFAMHLEKLKLFIAEHGHMNVPGKDKSGKRSKLLRWMIRQRMRYTALPNAYSNNRVMTQAEIDALNALGFQWEDGDDEEM